MTNKHKTLIMVTGISASGKTTLSHKLKIRINCKMLSMDDWQVRLIAAEHGYGLNVLRNDPSTAVRDAVWERELQNLQTFDSILERANNLSEEAAALSKYLGKLKNGPDIGLGG